MLDLLFPNLSESLNVQRDFKCKASFYTHRVMRGLSICFTCLLSVLQAITISPRTSVVGRIQQKCRNYITKVFLFFWSLNLTFNSNIIFYTVAYSGTNQTSVLSVSKYCSISPAQAGIRELFFTLTLSRDIFFVGLMLLSSAYMVFVLSRHQRQSRHLYGISLSPRASPEQRATQTILLLVSVFVPMYWINLIISSFSTLLWTYNPVLLNVQNIVLNAYAAVCPLIQTACHKRLKDNVKTLLCKYHPCFRR
uniref:vomeronasal type-1 receptor 90-like n=1 Tax=Jaculus jaculus TaxID=51337 RepID=UPI001E1AFD74|nr:vomeronasal type-1 receptor 90-like [Jaculus jaculus]